MNYKYLIDIDGDVVDADAAEDAALSVFIIGVDGYILTLASVEDGVIETCEFDMQEEVSDAIIRAHEVLYEEAEDQEDVDTSCLPSGSEANVYAFSAILLANIEDISSQSFEYNDGYSDLIADFAEGPAERSNDGFKNLLKFLEEALAHRIDYDVVAKMLLNDDIKKRVTSETVTSVPREAQQYFESAGIADLSEEDALAALRYDAVHRALESGISLTGDNVRQLSCAQQDASSRKNML